MLKSIMSKIWSPSGDKPADDLYVRGTQAIQAGRYIEAEAPLKASAELGSVSAMHNLGLLYKNGMASRFDLDEAIRLFALAAERGHARSAVEHETLVRHQQNARQASADLPLLAQNFNRSGGDGSFINAVAEISYAALTQSEEWPDEAFSWVYNQLEQIERIDSALGAELAEHLDIGPNESMGGFPLYDTFSATTARRLTQQLHSALAGLAQDGHDSRILLFTRCAILGRVIQRANLYPKVPLWGISRFTNNVQAASA